MYVLPPDFRSPARRFACFCCYVAAHATSSCLTCAVLRVVPVWVGTTRLSWCGVWLHVSGRSQPGGGTRYVRHLDATYDKCKPGQLYRAVTCLYYLNPTWHSRDGGQLCAEACPPSRVAQPMSSSCRVVRVAPLVRVGHVCCASWSFVCSHPLTASIAWLVVVVAVVGGLSVLIRATDCWCFGAHWCRMKCCRRTRHATH